ITTLFYVACGSVGYAAFGNNAPGNFLTGFGVYEPFWLIDIGNACIVIHLLGAYQVFGQPLYSFVEQWSIQQWPQSQFITKDSTVNIPFLGPINYFRLVWRTMYVIVTSLVALVLPFFTEFLGLMGALSFWPLGVYFPVEMYLAQTKPRKFSPKWISLKLLSLVCFCITVLAAVG
ncbi:hypothetical protein, partial [Ralstonia pseudosolanacearum]|uniref:hypothetical protein n=1 Tax=Ralstonia pseudosolanacearum TaxID=1310165 RepID=UPI003CEE6808